MATKNDITGDTIMTKMSDTYRENYDKIFRKKNLEGWEHHCKHDGHLTVEKGASCNWCGMKEDGTFD